jgi:tRNA-uridine 2-sulfurtransferase
MTSVLVGMSGGVDSSVAAALLVDQGYDVVGVTLKLWGGESDTGCCSVSDVEDARRVAQQLGIDHLVFNFTEDFDRHVVEPYVGAHVEGVTPNPCIECNRHLKFDRLTKRAELLGFDAVATGHHAQVADIDGARRILRGADAAKDQSYVVHMLDQRALAATMFPVGHLNKSDVRTIAAERGLRTAAKADSQDVCFITRAGREAFLGHRIPLRAGRVVDASGSVVGSVSAVELVTVGKRKGLGLGGGGDPLYAVAVDIPSATVTVGSRDQLLASSVDVERVVWSAEPWTGAARAQVSAHGSAHECTVEPIRGDSWRVHWRQPQRRVAKGQSVVLYDSADRYVLGCGISVG